MKLFKQSENYSIEGTVENGWKISGSVTLESSSAIYMHITVNDASDKYIGEIHYNKPSEEGANINMGYSVSEANRDILTTYADSVVDFILQELPTL